jgi:hypothetical protein
MQTKSIPHTPCAAIGTQRVPGTLLCNPFRVETEGVLLFSQGAAARQPWAIVFNPFGIGEPAMKTRAGLDGTVSGFRVSISTSTRDNLMRRLSILLILVAFLSMFGCTAQSPPHSERATEPEYVGRVEVLRGGKIIGSRQYTFRLHDLDVRPASAHAFHVVEKGEKVAVLRVYWPTFGLENQITETGGKQMTDLLGKQMADRFEKQTGQKAKVETSLSLTITSDFPLLKHMGGWYSLLARGTDDAEQYGYYAESDDDAIDIALNYLARFVVPMETGSRVYEFRQLRAHGARDAAADGRGPETR